MATIEKSYLDAFATVVELTRRINILREARDKALTTTMRFKYEAQMMALNSFLDWVNQAPWEIKTAEG